MSDNTNMVFALIFQCGGLALGPVIGFFLAKRRGASPWLGAALGLGGCIGWAAIYILPSDKPLEPKNQAGRSFNVDEETFEDNQR